MTDPRAELRDAAGERSVLPVVTRPRSGLSGPALALCMLTAAVLLFIVLDGRRRSVPAPSAAMRSIDMTALPSAPPPLVIPPEVIPRTVDSAAPIMAPSPPRSILPLRLQPAPAPPLFAASPAQTLSPQPAPPTRLPGSGGPALAIDNSLARNSGAGGTSASSSITPSAQSGAPSIVGGTDRVRAGMIADRSTTVPQGTLIPAVLETAFNSTRAGFARAIVARNVVGFDGTRVLIPRGSRLIGEYQSDATPGQKRALIVWTRLIRDDGATIAIASPAADTLGRGGVAAHVDSHFFEHFSGAILQSALDVGVNLASRAANGTVVLALPGALQNTSGAQSLQQNTIPPTLTVKAGTSISIFVARDLDFTDVERRP